MKQIKTKIYGGTFIHWELIGSCLSVWWAIGGEGLVMSTWIGQWFQWQSKFLHFARLQKQNFLNKKSLETFTNENQVPKYTYSGGRYQLLKEYFTHTKKGKSCQYFLKSDLNFSVHLMQTTWLPEDSVWKLCGLF